MPPQAESFDLEEILADSRATDPAPGKWTIAVDDRSHVVFPFSFSVFVTHSRSRRPDQDWFWTPEWQRMEEEADEDIAAGRTRNFQSTQDLRDWLRGR